jgi:hypothetical protein
MANVVFSNFTANVAPSLSANVIGYFNETAGSEQRWTHAVLRALYTAALTSANISNFNTAAAAAAPVQSVAGQTGAVDTIPAANVSGLGTAATTNASDYATAAQGTLADSAVQPGSLANVATSGAYADLSGLPTLGTAAATNSDAYATAAQGALADSAVQPGSLANVATTGAYGDLSGTPTIPDAIFVRVAVTGQDNIDAASANDVLTIAAGSNVTVTTNATTKTVTIAAAGGGGGGGGLADPGANGIVVRTAANVTTARTIEGGNGVTISNGNGVSANPSVSVANASTTVLGIVELATDGQTDAGVAVQGNDGRLSNARTPTAHASTHVTAGSDKIRDATAAQDGLMTSAYASKLDGIPANATNNTGTVTSVAVSGSDGIEIDSGSPITSSGTITLGVNAATMRTHLNVANGATANAGTVTSVNGSGGTTGLTLGGGPITNSGTLTLSGVLNVANGGSGAATHTANAVLIGNGTGAFTSVAPGTSANVLTSNGTAWISQAPAGGGGGSGTLTYAYFAPQMNQPPSANFATLDTRGNVAVLDFDDTIQEAGIFVAVMPNAASLGSGLTVNVHWAATSATSGNCRWGAQFQRLNSNIAADSFGAASVATTTTSGTSGVPSITSIAVSNIASIAAGDAYRLRVYRDAADAADNMSGDAECIAIEVKGTA